MPTSDEIFDKILQDFDEITIDTVKKLFGVLYQKQEEQAELIEQFQNNTNERLLNLEMAQIREQCHCESCNCDEKDEQPAVARKSQQINKNTSSLSEPAFDLATEFEQNCPCCGSFWPHYVAVQNSDPRHNAKKPRNPPRARRGTAHHPGSSSLPVSAGNSGTRNQPEKTRAKTTNGSKRGSNSRNNLKRGSRRGKKPTEQRADSEPSKNTNAEPAKTGRSSARSTNNEAGTRNQREIEKPRDFGLKIPRQLMTSQLVASLIPKSRSSSKQENPLPLMGLDVAACSSRCGRCGDMAHSTRDHDLFKLPR